MELELRTTISFSLRSSVNNNNNSEFNIIDKIPTVSGARCCRWGSYIEKQPPHKETESLDEYLGRYALIPESWNRSYWKTVSWTETQEVTLAWIKLEFQSMWRDLNKYPGHSVVISKQPCLKNKATPDSVQQSFNKHASIGSTKKLATWQKNFLEKNNKI